MPRRKPNTPRATAVPGVEELALETQSKVRQMKENAAKRPKPTRALAPIPKGMKIGQYIQLEVQKLMSQQDPKSKEPRTRLHTLLESVYKRAIDMRSGQGKASAELILAYGYEKPKPATDELEAMAKSGFQVVHVYAGGLEGVEKAPQLPAPAPDFVDAEIVEDEK